MNDKDNNMGQYNSIDLKEFLETTPLQTILEIYADDDEVGVDENNNVKNNTRHKRDVAAALEPPNNNINNYEEFCWKILNRRIRDTSWFRIKGGNIPVLVPGQVIDRTPTLEQVLRVSFCERKSRGESSSVTVSNANDNINSERRTTRPSPPDFALTTMIQLCQTPHDIKCLVQKYPKVLHLVEESTGDIVLHKVAKMGFLRGATSVFEYILLQGIEHNVKDPKEGFGGLTTKNRSMKTPLILMYEATAGGRDKKRWRGLSRIIKRVACMHALSQLQNSSSNNNAVHHLTEEMVLTFPILNAALEIECPHAIIKYILYRKWGSRYSRRVIRHLHCRDFLGRTPMQIACSTKCIGRETADTILLFLQVDPDLAKNSLVFHTLLKSGTVTPAGCQSIIGAAHKNDNVDDVYLVGSFIEIESDLLITRDAETKLCPFALAAMEGGGWSLGVIYGLLRTAPYAIDSYRL